MLQNMFYTSYQRTPTRKSVDRMLLNHLATEIVGYDEDVAPRHGESSDAPPFARICDDKSQLVHLMAGKGIFTKRVWGIMLKLHQEDATFRLDMIMVATDPYLTWKERGGRLRMWLKQKHRSGFYFDQETTELFNKGDGSVFRQAKFDVLMNCYSQYLSNTSFGAN